MKKNQLESAPEKAEKTLNGFKIIVECKECFFREVLFEQTSRSLIHDCSNCGSNQITEVGVIPDRNASVRLIKHFHKYPSKTIYCGTLRKAKSMIKPSKKDQFTIEYLNNGKGGQ